MSAEHHSTRQSTGHWSRPRHSHGQLNLHVSYLAQTRKPTTVILYSPEYVGGAANADRSSYSQVAAGRLLIKARRSDHIQPIGIFRPYIRRGASRRDTIRP